MQKKNQNKIRKKQLKIKNICKKKNGHIKISFKINVPRNTPISIGVH